MINQRYSTEFFDESNMNYLARNVLLKLHKNTSVARNLTAAVYQNVNHANTKTQLQPQRNLSLTVVKRGSQNLLKFPAFPLEDTLKKFLKSAEPHLHPDELKEVAFQSDKFLKGVGGELQKLLENTATKEENWLATRWLKAAYLQYRDPVCVFSSPGMTFLPQNFNSDNDYLKYSAKVIYGALKYKQIIDEKKIPVLKMGKMELDNSQFERILGTCRIPGVKEDTMEYYPESEHIVVIYKHHFYKLPVYTNCGEILNGDIIFEKLKEIYEGEKNMGVPIGVLTSDNRDNWGKAYQELMAIPENNDKVKEIQKSLFVVCLDQEVPIVYGQDEMNVVSEQLIHGGGANQNAGNRWFDKCIQVILNRNGVGGFCYEHSPAEGGPVALMSDYIIKFAKEGKFDDGGIPDSCFAMKKLNIETSPKLNEFIEKSKGNVNKLASDLDVNVLHYKSFGKEFLKAQKLSPDSFIQTALQFAFYRLHKTPGAHYESAHLRIYANGRTETIRSCSTESIEFSKSMNDNLKTDQDRVDLLRKAVNGHREYTNQALLGKGVDRHFLGLKLMALENRMPVPDFLKLPTVTKTAHFRLSTSQVASEYESFMCYGPLTSDGYGCCYNPRRDDIFFSVSSWKTNNETCSIKFAKSLGEALNHMMSVLQAAGEKPKSKL